MGWPAPPVPTPMDFPLLQDPFHPLRNSILIYKLLYCSSPHSIPHHRLVAARINIHHPWVQSIFSVGFVAAALIRFSSSYHGNNNEICINLHLRVRLLIWLTLFCLYLEKNNYLLQCQRTDKKAWNRRESVFWLRELRWLVLPSKRSWTTSLMIVMILEPTQPLSAQYQKAQQIGNGHNESESENERNLSSDEDE